MRPLISVIVPVYNQQENLLLALESIEKQTYENVEVIVVDDGSVEELRTRNLGLGTIPLQLVRQENKGAPAARNRGFELSKGGYVIFWDADVVGEPDMLEKLKKQLSERPEASFAYSNHYFGKRKMSGQHFTISALQRNNYIHTTSLVRRKDFPGFDELLKRFQDWDLWLTMGENGKKGVWVDEYLFTVKPGGTMSRWLPKFAYKKPWKWLPGIALRVRAYENAKKVIQKKHSLVRNHCHSEEPVEAT
jgi:glycosyltransferase involved in cell wall biosynthesis